MSFFSSALRSSFRLARRVVVLGGFLTALVLPLPSLAVQSPAGCNSNRMNISLVKDKTLVSPGDVITYTVTVSNVDSGSFIACDITNASIVFTYPAADGTDTGSTLTLASGASYPAGTPITTLATVPYTVAVNAGVTDVVAKVELDGDLNDAPSNHSTQIIKTLGTTVQPAATATPTPTPTPQVSLPRLPRTGSR